MLKAIAHTATEYRFVGEAEEKIKKYAQKQGLTYIDAIYDLIIRTMVMNLGNGKVKNFYVHRLVTDAYLPNPDNLPQVNHKDENKANNCLQNLEWCDAKYNNNYGTHIEKIKKPILQFDLEGNLIHEWPSATDVGSEVRTNIVMCLTGRTNSAYGYKWVYKN